MEEPVTIVDREILKVLSVDTRMNILKELSKGKRTPSDLSKILNKSDATIVEHLDILAKSELVKKIEEPGKKWVFYTLTEKGYGIISSKSRKLVILLVSSILAFVGGLFAFVQYFIQYREYRAEAFVGGEVLKGISKTVVAPLLLLSITLFVASSIGFFVYFLKIKTKR
ncbi:MAG: winged helix-turn-helix domain-containing protein [Candidatus Aenigmatarchaeota archaeon]